MKFVLILFLLFLPSYAGEVEGRAIYIIQSRDELTSSESPRTAHYKHYSVWIYLKNVGHATIRIPTASWIEATFPDEATPTQYVALRRWEDQYNPLGIKSVVSEAKLGIVVLRPDETAVIETKVFVDEIKYQKLRIAYEVEEDFAKRNNLWHGKVSMIAERFDLSSTK
jgi:hypothetical protein